MYHQYTRSKFLCTPADKNIPGLLFSVPVIKLDKQDIQGYGQDYWYCDQPQVLIYIDPKNPAKVKHEESDNNPQRQAADRQVNI